MALPFPVKTFKSKNHNFSDNRQEDLFISGVPVPKLISEFGIDLAELNPYLPIDPGLTKRWRCTFWLLPKVASQGAYYCALKIVVSRLHQKNFRNI